ncbi:type II toxin-antitoxin system PemK/MazF family toxin [Rothia sp. LK2588]|uniref:type II toxin-antitoxin system PemK/MazF family toxin n=1 Tax=Rothia sp. LK2588 TaxID=3114369 RepID=UPI0034CEB573
MKFNLGTLRRVLNFAQQAYSQYQKLQPRRTEPTATQRSDRRTTTPVGSSSSFYPGDYTGQFAFEYSPIRNGQAEPGEVVWTWVPFEEDYSQGKDRPVLIVGEDGPYLLGLMLTSKDRNNRFEHDPHYVDIGSGSWDRQGRPSEVKLNRVIRVDPTQMRREGSPLDRRTFESVKAAFLRQSR